MSVLHQLIKRVPDENRAIAVPNGPSLNFKELRYAVSDLQAQLSALRDPILSLQNTIAVSLPNSLEFTTVFLAVTQSSLCVAPLNPNYKQREFEFYIGDMSARLLIVARGAANGEAISAAKRFGTAVAEVYVEGKLVKLQIIVPPKPSHRITQALRAPKPEDVAFVLHTSGTTGRPKAVPLLHRNMLATARNIIGTYHLNSNDVSYLVMPLFHVHGLLAGLLSPLASGGAVIIPPKFSAHRFFDEWQRYGATWYSAVPTIHQIVLKQPLPSPKPKVRFIRSCSSSLAPTTFHELEKKLGAPVLEAYAMTEACHQMTSNSLAPDLRKPGTVGISHGDEVVILNDDGKVLLANQIGEVGVRGQNVTPGYLNNPKANAESFTSTGYFRTGDQGYIDDDGMLVLTGRLKELINRGGEKISPIELDSVLLSHPSVSEAVAFGAPDSLYGQQVQAAVVLNPNSHVTEEELKKYVGSKLASHKVPTRIYFTKVMPKTATGKIQRRIIASKFASKL